MMRKPHRNRPTPRYSRFLLVWMLSTLVVGAIVSISFDMIINLTYEIANYTYMRLSTFFVMSVVTLFIWLMFVTITLTMQQKIILNRLMEWSLPGWRRLSVMGAVLAYAVILGTNYLPFVIRLQPFIYAIVLGMIATAQLFILKEQVHHSLLWLLANVSGGILISLFVNQAINSLLPVEYFTNMMLAAFSYATITGTTLWYLHHNRIEADDYDDDDYARVYVEVYSDPRR